jgi:hypothetical protein
MDREPPLSLMIKQLLAGWEVSVIGTQAGELADIARHARQTPDVFVLPHFLPVCDYPRFLDYFLGSRQVDVVLNIDSTFGYLLLPDFCRRFPHVTWLGVLEGREGVRQKPLFPFIAEVGRVLCDAFVVWTQEQWDCLTSQGVNPTDIHMWQVDAGRGRPGGSDPINANTDFSALAKEIMHRHAEKPRILSEQVTGEIATTLAVELLRRETQLKNNFPDVDKFRPQLLDPRSASWRTFFYFALRRLVLPHYRTMSERPKEWLLPLVRWAKKTLARQ